MKKVLFGFLIVGLIFGGYVWYKKFNGNHYYVQINREAKIGESKGMEGKKYKDYTYSLTGYDKNGKSQTLELIESRKLKQGAYLDVLYNKERGVLSWIECDKNKIPKEALKHLE